MAEKTSIEWTDSSWNPWIGCTRVSPACDDCYAARSTPARAMKVQWGAGQPRHRTAASTWKKPLQWNARQFYECSACGWRGDDAPFAGARCPAPGCGKGGALTPARRRVFCASLADWLDNEAPIAWFVDLLDLIRQTPNIDWLLLSKRIGNWRNRMEGAANWARVHRGRGLVDFIESWLGGWQPPNVWAGSTVVNQPEADRDIPKLLAVPARVRFLSIEPMLGPIDLVAASPAFQYDTVQKVHWVIVGGESGPKARPVHPDWVRSLRDQCQAAGVPFFFKQWGEWAPTGPVNGPDIIVAHDGRTCEFSSQAMADLQRGGSILPATLMYRVGKKVAGRRLDGRTWDEFPKAAS